LLAEPYNRSVSLRDSLFRLLNRGATTADENEPVEIGVVPLLRGPMLVTLLRDRGFDASGSETFSVVTDIRSDYRIFVPRREATAATDALDELR
jgi:hypothetical protein